MTTAFVVAPGPITGTSIEEFTLDAPPTLEQLQEWVGGPIERVNLDFWPSEGGPAPCITYVNEEGKLRGLSVNHLATALWRIQVRTTDWLVGPVVVVIL